MRIDDQRWRDETRPHWSGQTTVTRPGTRIIAKGLLRPREKQSSVTRAALSRRDRVGAGVASVQSRHAVLLHPAQSRIPKFYRIRKVAHGGF